jgi:dipeptidyl aminopeptidase/acylaminoacyl peptidase
MTGWLQRLICICAAMAAPTAFATDNNLIPLKQIARLPVFTTPQLSPAGTHVAAIMVLENEQNLVVQQLLAIDKRREKPFAIDLGEYKFDWFDWANNERLLLGVRITDAVAGDQWNFIRIGAIGRDGKNPLVFNVEANDNGRYRQIALVVSKLQNDPDHILAALDDTPNGWGEPQVHKVNVNTGKRTLVERNRRGIYRWVADADGQLRIGIRYSLANGQRKATVLYRETDSDSWQKLQKTDYFDHERLEPYRFDKEDPNILLVTSATLADQDQLNEGESTLYRYDLQKREIAGEYENTALREVQDAVENVLADKHVEMVSRDAADNLFLFRVYSDTLSPEYYLLNRSAGKLDYVAAEYPELIDYELAEMQEVSYAARDGLNIPALMTLPVAAKPEKLPFVIYPHGGPWAHDNWGFDNYVQFFANRGYGVFQPQFRGSTGLGVAHEEAGYGQWGYAIQDDISDGVQWLIDEGFADPERICIVGSSFGGYAAAAGLAKTPELYTCGISINGVMDLKQFVDSSRKQFFGNVNKAMWNSRSEAEEASPYHLAKNIRAPLLLIASEDDTVVPSKHSKRMYKKLKRNKQAVQYEVLPGGEHWRTNEKLELQKLALIEEFLARHLGTTTR